MLPVGTNVRRNEIPKATLVIIGLNFFIFVLCALLPDEVYVKVVENFGFGPPSIWNPLAPFTSMFLHGSATHVVFNMLFLWVFGAPLEERIGRKHYITWYLGAGLVAGFLQTFSEFARAGFEGVVSIGASGAVSGIMAIYVYRCYYSKLRMVIEPMFLPVGIHIPAAPLVIFWFLKDLYFGLSGAATGIGHFAHVGGFIFGIVVARIKRYGLEGRIESLREQINKRLEEGGGWEEAEQSLKDLLELAPGDPEVNHDLARLYAARNSMDKAAAHYRKAIERYFQRAPLFGAYAVIESVEALGNPMPMKLHLQSANAMVGQYQLEDAWKVLALGSRQKLDNGPSTEQGLALFIKVGHALGKNIQKPLELFRQRFPRSRLIPDLKKTLAEKPGKVFAHFRDRVDSAALEMAKRKPTRSEQGINAMAYIMDIIASPYFVISWMGSAVLVGIFYAAGLLPSFSGLWTQLTMLVAAIGLTVAHRQGWFDPSGRKSQEKAHAAFDLTRGLQDARRAEREDRFADAAHLFEQCLLKDPGDVSVRMSLAFIYHRKLGEYRAAVQHYRMLMEQVEAGTPFYRDAQEGLREATESLEAQPAT